MKKNLYIIFAIVMLIVLGTGCARSNDEQAESLYRHGLKFDNQSNWLEAISFYDKIIEQYSKYPEAELQEQVARAYSYKGHALYRLGKADDAITNYNQMLNHFDQSKTKAVQLYVADVIFKKGFTLDMLNKNADALVCYEEIIKKFNTPEFPNIKDTVSLAVAGREGKFKK